MKKRRRERGGRRGGRKGVFSFSLFNVTSSAARNCSPLYPPLSSPFPSLTPLRHPSSTPPSPPSGWTGWVTNLKKSQKRLTHFLPRDEAMGQREAEDIWEQGEGKRLRAECADDQDQEDRRRFDTVVEQLGPVKFRRLAGEWFAAQVKGDGESGTMARDGGKQDLENDEAMRTYIRKLMQWSRAGQLTHHLTRKLPKHDRAAHEVEEDLRQHVVCAVACKRARKAKVLTEESFLNDNLSSKMSEKSWKLVQEARKYWRPTIVVEVPGPYLDVSAAPGKEEGEGGREGQTREPDLAWSQTNRTKVGLIIWLRRRQ